MTLDTRPHRAVTLKRSESFHPDPPRSHLFYVIYITGSDLGRSSRHTPLSAAYFSSWHFIPVVLPGLCAHSPNYLPVFVRPVRFVLMAVAHFVRSCLCSHPSGLTYPRRSLSRASAKTKPPTNPSFGFVRLLTYIPNAAVSGPSCFVVLRAVCSGRPAVPLCVSAVRKSPDYLQPGNQSRQPRPGRRAIIRAQQ